MAHLSSNLFVFCVCVFGMYAGHLFSRPHHYYHWLPLVDYQEELEDTNSVEAGHAQSCTKPVVNYAFLKTDGTYTYASIISTTAL